MAIEIPWLPEDASIIVPPGFKRPCFSACSTIYNAERSLTLPPGLRYSNFAYTRAGES